MPLTVMTQEWTQLANRITIFLIHERMHDEEKMQELTTEPIRLYNYWVTKECIAINNAELALWCMQYIKSMINMPLSRLKTAAEIDGLKY